MNYELNKRFHKFLTDSGQMEDKAEIVFEISKGRTRSSRELEDIEVRAYLSEYQSPKTQKPFVPKGGDVCDKKRKKIIAIFRSVGWSVERVKQWVSNLKGFSKPFNDFTSDELSKIISIAERERENIINQFKP